MCINGLSNVVITSIERRFGLSSSQTGLIASSYDIASLIVTVPITYFGGRPGASKPKWIGGGLLLMGLGSFLWSLPHFLTGTYRGGAGNGTEVEELLCVDGGGGGGGDTSDTCDDNDVGLASYRWDV